ncbi:UNVERIFIED_CONTAM: hypothetical protein Sradi_6461400 [Sesamum radiatum]|uniref:Uncharacterized protein n=1 Tax=Sesamum radiatum TaxID=300843 RepID=A0AAW2K500_SESRA
MIFQFNGVIPTASVFSQCFQLKRTESGIFHFASRRGVSFIPTLSPPKWWKGSFFFVLPPRPWTISNRWIDDAPPALPFSLDDRSPNLCRLLQRLNESPYACKLMAKDRLLGHFGLSPRIEPLGKALGISVTLFSYFLMNSLRNCLSGFILLQKASCSTSFSEKSIMLLPRLQVPGLLRGPLLLEIRGERSCCFYPGSSSKRPRPSFSVVSLTISTRHIPTPPPPPPPPRDYRGGSSRSPSSPAAGGGGGGGGGDI